MSRVEHCTSSHDIPCMHGTFDQCNPSKTRHRFVACAQSMGIFNATLEAMKAAGVVLVPFNASSLVEYHDKYIGDPTFYTMELGRELSR